MKVAPMREDPRGGASRRLVSPPRSYGEGPGVGFFGRRRMAFQASGSLARPTPGASPQEAGRGIASASSLLPVLTGRGIAGARDLPLRLGFDHEIDVVADVGNGGLHPEVRTLQAAAGRKADRVGPVAALAHLVEGDLEGYRLGDSEQGEISNNLSAGVVLLGKGRADEGHLRKLFDVEIVGPLQVGVTWGELRLQARGLDRHIQFARPGFGWVEADAATEVGEQSYYLGKPQMIDEEQNMGVVRVDLVVGRARRRCHDQSGEGYDSGQRGNAHGGFLSVIRDFRDAGTATSRSPAVVTRRRFRSLPIPARSTHAQFWAAAWRQTGRARARARRAPMR